MAFCPKCGNVVADGSMFCNHCGNPINVQYVQPVQPVQPVQYYVKPKIPGRGFGISSMVLGIIGLFYGFVFLMALTDIPYYAAESMLPSVLMFSVLSILAVCFGAAARNRGYNNGICKSGLTMGIIGLCFYVIAMIQIFAAM